MIVFGFFNLFWSIVVIGRHAEWTEIGAAAKIIVRIAIYFEIILTGLFILGGVSVLLMKVVFVILSFNSPKRAIRKKVEITEVWAFCISKESVALHSKTDA